MEQEERLNELRRYLTNLGLTQEEIAKRLGVSKGTVGNYESGAREPKDFETLEMIADFFNCDIDFLIGRKNTRPEYTLEEMTIIELYR